MNKKQKVAKAKQREHAKKLVVEPKASANGKPGVMETLARLFSQEKTPSAEACIAEVARATGHMLKPTTLALYRSKWLCAGFPTQKGIRPAVKIPVFVMVK
jgi:hypothetical protein